LLFIGHASFLIESGNSRILLDPFFKDKFWWYDHYEYRITPLRVKPTNIPCPHAILVTHEHGDHFDHETILEILDRCKNIPVYSTRPVIEQLYKKRRGKYHVVHRNHGILLRDIKITPIQNTEETTNKYSFLLEKDKKKLFYSGDCHKMPPDLTKITKIIDVLIIWPKEEVIEDFLKLSVKNIILMHYDKFKPGKFLCNINPSKFRERLIKKYPKINVMIPSSKDC